MILKFLSNSGLATLLSQLKQIFSTSPEVSDIEQNTKTYVLDVDYSRIAFDTNELISNVIYDDIAITRTDLINCDLGSFGIPHVELDLSLFDYKAKQYNILIDDALYTLLGPDTNNERYAMWVTQTADLFSGILLIVDADCPFAYLCAATAFGEEGSEHHVIIYDPDNVELD